MKKVLMSIFLTALFTVNINAQNLGDWYVGTGDIANTAWTEWSVEPTIGYGVTDKLMIGMNVSQEDSTVDMSYDLHARYFTKGYFVYVATNGLSTDAMSVGLGKMFTLRNGIYVDPKIVYNTEMKTTNLTLGFGLKF